MIKIDTKYVKIPLSSDVKVFGNEKAYINQDEYIGVIYNPETFEPMHYISV